MTATAVRADETLREELANAIQILTQDDTTVDELDLAAVRIRLRAALDRADELESKYRAAVDLLRENEKERQALQDDAEQRGEFIDSLEIGDLHVVIPFEQPAGTPYVLQRRYARTLARCETREQVATLKQELAKLANTLMKNRKD